MTQVHKVEKEHLKMAYRGFLSSDGGQAYMRYTSKLNSITTGGNDESDKRQRQGNYGEPS